MRTFREKVNQVVTHVILGSGLIYETSLVGIHIALRKPPVNWSGSFVKYFYRVIIDNKL